MFVSLLFIVYEALLNKLICQVPYVSGDIRYQNKHNNMLMTYEYLTTVQLAYFIYVLPT